MEKSTAVTEKGAPSHASTGDARVNLFFKTVRGVATDSLHALLDAAWRENDLDTLRLIFQTRDCRGGKGEKKIFIEGLKWLAANHPEALAKNIQHVPFFGTWKDLLGLMGTSFEDPALKLFAEQLKKDLDTLPLAKQQAEERAKKSHEQKLAEKLEKMEIEAEKKEEDKDKIEISLCAKWAPTEGHNIDSATKASRKLAKKLFPKSKNPLKEYRKVYLVPLREHLKVTEVYMCSGNWNKINYQGVPSRCMNLERKAFTKHDSARFAKFLELVKSGKATIKGKQMFPHELCKYYYGGKPVDDVIELQWKTIIDGVKESGAFKNSIVLSDVSGSMSGTPMDVSIALGLLISEVTEPPFQNIIITFHETPTFHMVQGTTLKDRVSNVRNMAWGGTTNFQAVFDLILTRAQQNKLPDSAMPRRLFVLSDMQFDQADGGNQFKTNHQVIAEKYAKAGYTMPTIVYWNLRANTGDFPVTVNESGVALVSGFSPSLLKLLMDDGELDAGKAADASKVPEQPKIDPYIVMRKAVDDERYAILTL